MLKKQLCGRLVLLAAVFGCGGYWAALSVAQAQAPATRIAVDVRKFAFAPAEIRVKKGQVVTFVLSTTDFVHGFAIPDFNARVDVIPGKATELTIKPDKGGKFHLLCDNFCGEGHDKMSGFLVVDD